MYRQGIWTCNLIKKDVAYVKKEYTAPEMTVEEIEIEDVITRSGPGRPGSLDEDEEDGLI